MIPSFIPSIPAPELEDSTDLSDTEVGHATATEDAAHLTRLLMEALSPGQASIGKSDARYALGTREIRRRKPHLYLRCHLVCPDEAPKVLVYCVDWLHTLT